MKPVLHLLPLLFVAACASTPAPPPVSVAAVGEVRPGTGFPKGYLAAAQVPDSLALVPPPPAEGSAAMAADREAYQTAVAQTTPERWALAAADANLVFPASVKGFSDILGLEINSTATPHLAMLLQRTMIDAGLGTYKAKTHYARVRPFVAMESQTCSPQDEAALRKDGSYPSGHASIGWAWALVLTQVAPDKADALLQRGRDFGESRVVCRVHWRSDVAAGRFVAAGIVARLQSDPVFTAQMALARGEVAATRR
jgi:acid phosphatase (class A)